MSSKLNINKIHQRSNIFKNNLEIDVSINKSITTDGYLKLLEAIAPDDELQKIFIYELSQLRSLDLKNFRGRPQETSDFKDLNEELFFFHGNIISQENLDEDKEDLKHSFSFKFGTQFSEYKGKDVLHSLVSKEQNSMLPKTSLSDFFNQNINFSKLTKVAHGQMVFLLIFLPLQF